MNKDTNKHHFCAEYRFYPYDRVKGVSKDSGISSEMVDPLRVLSVHHVGLRSLEHLVSHRRHRKKGQTQKISESLLSSELFKDIWLE